MSFLFLPVHWGKMGTAVGISVRHRCMDSADTHVFLLRDLGMCSGWGCLRRCCAPCVGVTILLVLGHGLVLPPRHWVCPPRSLVYSACPLPCQCMLRWQSAKPLCVFQGLLSPVRCRRQRRAGDSVCSPGWIAYSYNSESHRKITNFIGVNLSFNLKRRFP